MVLFRGSETNQCWHGTEFRLGAESRSDGVACIFVGIVYPQIWLLSTRELVFSDCQECGYTSFLGESLGIFQFHVRLPEGKSWRIPN